MDDDDFPEIGNDTPYQVILDQTKQAGYEGGSTGHNYPTHLPSLLYSLHRRDLLIVSTWFGTTFTTGVDFDAAITAFQQQLDFLQSVNATDVVVAELANAVNQVRSVPVLTARPILNTAQWYLLTTLLDTAGKLAQERGMQLSYHPHVGTGVMTIEETERLLASTNDKYVGLCLDTAHLCYGGADQAALVNLTKKHVKRITHVHLKNVRKKVREKAVQRRIQLLSGDPEGIFTVPADPAARGISWASWILTQSWMRCFRLATTAGWLWKRSRILSTQIRSLARKRPGNTYEVVSAIKYDAIRFFLPPPMFAETSRGL